LVRRSGRIFGLGNDTVSFFSTIRMTLFTQCLHNLSSRRRLESRGWRTTGVESGWRELSASREASWGREAAREARRRGLEMVRKSSRISQSGELTTTTWEARSTRETGETRRGSTTNTSSRTLITVSNMSDIGGIGAHTAREGGAAPRPAGRATPGPAARAEEIPPGALFPRRALGSAGGGDSTEREMM
jgi:hypothetical protein